jgi:hypothetical protein
MTTSLLRSAIAIAPLLCAAIALAAAVPLCAQEATAPAGAAGAVAVAATPLPPPAAFRGISLGMNLESVKTALQADPLFGYRGDPDVAFQPQAREQLVECEGIGYIERAWFQFVDGRLAVMILVLDPHLVDHYSVFTALSRKYGDPITLGPRECVWLSESVRFSLERPLTVKWLELKTFSEQVARGAAQLDLEQLSRERFIEQF